MTSNYSLWDRLQHRIRKIYCKATFQSKPAAFPDAHFYSPVVDTKETMERQTSIWPVSRKVSGIDFNHKLHYEAITEWFPLHIDEFDFPTERPKNDNRFFLNNSQFGGLDARALFAFLRYWRPKRIIEVGSGYSTLLIADIRKLFLDQDLEIVCIEPYPGRRWKADVKGITRLIEKKVQDVPFEAFDILEPGDILFIDSSHVVKTGSDVTHLYLNILPRLKRGVRIHLHDVFLPLDYPREWVITENRSWNEQYLVQALLMFSSGFRVLFGSTYASLHFPDEISLLLNQSRGPLSGSSFWIERL